MMASMMTRGASKQPLVVLQTCMRFLRFLALPTQLHCHNAEKKAKIIQAMQSTPAAHSVEVSSDSHGTSRRKMRVKRASGDTFLDLREKVVGAERFTATSDH